MAAIIELNFYDENCEISETHRTFLPFGALEEAADLGVKLEKLEPEAAFAAVGEFIVKLFKGKFGLQDLREKADMAEVLSILPNINARVSQLSGPVNFQKGRGKK